MAGHESQVVLHVGVPKSGTTFLQRALAQNAETLRMRGVLYPRRHDQGDDLMFRAALDVRSNHKAWGRQRRDVTGAWHELCGQARRHGGATVISHELLAGASRRQITAAMTLLKGLDVHLVVTARDLARQLTAEWQEGIKHGRRASFAEFFQRVSADDPADELARRFHLAQDLPEVLARWGEWLPPENVHVVVAGDPGAESHLLWNRFGEAAGFATQDLALPGPEHANTSLGVTQIDLLRRVNTALDGRLVQPAYGRTVKQYFARQLLPNYASPRPLLPVEHYDTLAAPSERWVKEIRKAGYTVHGDLHDLIPAPPAGARVPHPDDTDPAEETVTAAAVIAELLLEVDRLRNPAASSAGDRPGSWKAPMMLFKRRLAELTSD